ncbi:MAG: class I SAM-dependent methyltransferase [Thermodesulfobacteriota bacterium]
MTGEPCIGVEHRPHCYLCGSPGNRLYGGLRDGLYNAPGRWNLSSCRRCGLVWLDPRPLPEEIWKTYGTYCTHSAAPSGSSPRLARLRNRIGEAVLATCYGYERNRGDTPLRGIPAGLCRAAFVRDIYGIPIMGLRAAWRGRLLDVGCGDGAFLARMNRLGWETVGVEPDAKAADRAKAHFGVDVIAGTLDQADFPDGSFDAITLSHVVEHLAEPAETLRRCWQLLRKGGRIMVTSPNAQSLGHRIFREHWRGLEVPRHLLIFSLHTLRRMAADAGFATAALRTSARGAHALYLESRLLKAGKWTENPWPRAGGRLKMESLLFQLLEEAVGAVRKTAGEELFFEGIKP